MRDNKKNHKVDTARRKQAEAEAERIIVQQKLDEVYNRVGEHIDKHQIAELLTRRHAGVADDEAEWVRLQFNLILQLLYKSRVAFRNVHDTVVGIMSILWGVPEEDIKQKLMCSSTMIKWGQYRANYFSKLSLSLYIVLFCPKSHITFKNDGTERNKDNLMGHVIEFEISNAKKQAFKTCLLNGQMVGIDYFAAYERSKTVSRLVFSYNQSVGKTAECLKECTEQSLEDLDEFMKIWQSDDNVNILISEFGRSHLDFTSLKDRVTAFGHDRHKVKILLYVIYVSHLYQTNCLTL